ncbi:MAG: hypothetical protein COT14_03735 [Candidatus Diapherotrites archaeon CG08_land_8_20_14_0_20_30_16]|nr:MAG: hypothetical protein COT14_03735 [Candidatus Diapherotrites archaeon CG08_land_8_20_14_0_20_30_16]
MGKPNKPREPRKPKEETRVHLLNDYKQRKDPKTNVLVILCEKKSLEEKQESIMAYCGAKGLGPKNVLDLLTEIGKEIPDRIRQMMAENPRKNKVKISKLIGLLFVIRMLKRNIREVYSL